MALWIAIAVGSVLGTAAAWFRGRGHRIGVVAMVVLQLISLVILFFAAGDAFVVGAVLLVMAFVAGYFELGAAMLRGRRAGDDAAR